MFSETQISGLIKHTYINKRRKPGRARKASEVLQKSSSITVGILTDMLNVSAFSVSNTNIT